MNELLPLASQIASKLMAAKQTVSVAESSTGGLISAALLSVPGASAYYIGGSVVYTRVARRVIMDMPDASMRGVRSASEVYATMLAEQMRARLATDWAIAETGASGPTGNGYGDAAGHSCIAIVGPSPGVETLETGATDRVGNMRAFAKAALGLLLERL